MLLQRDLADILIIHFQKSDNLAKTGGDVKLDSEILKVGYELGIANLSKTDGVSMRMNGIYCRLGYNF